MWENDKVRLESMERTTSEQASIENGTRVARPLHDGNTLQTHGWTSLHGEFLAGYFVEQLSSKTCAGSKIVK